MWYQLNQLYKKVEQRRQQKLCVRCGLLYKKSLADCPHCHHIQDDQLRQLLEKRARFRLTMGKTMFLLAFVITLMILFFS